MDNGSSLVYDPAVGHKQLCFSYHIQRRHLCLVAAMQFLLYLLAIS